MNARRLGLAVSLLALAVVAPLWARAQGMARIESTPMFQNEGRDRVEFNTTCATATWTVIVASDTIARSTFMQSISSNTQAICLSSATSSQNCNSSAKGPEISPSSNFTDYSRAGWACKAVTGTSAQTIKGYRTRDRGDYGAVGFPER